MALIKKLRKAVRFFRSRGLLCGLINYFLEHFSLDFVIKSVTK